MKQRKCGEKEVREEKLRKRLGEVVGVGLVWISVVEYRLFGQGWRRWEQNHEETVGEVVGVGLVWIRGRVPAVRTGWRRWEQNHEETYGTEGRRFPARGLQRISTSVGLCGAGWSPELVHLSRSSQRCTNTRPRLSRTLCRCHHAQATGRQVLLANAGKRKTPRCSVDPVKIASTLDRRNPLSYRNQFSICSRSI
jgi:hypothetical protein